MNPDYHASDMIFGHVIGTIPYDEDKHICGVEISDSNPEEVLSIIYGTHLRIQKGSTLLFWGHPLNARGLQVDDRVIFYDES